MDYCENELDVFIILDDFNTLDNNIRVMELGEKQPSSLKYEKSEAYGQDGFTKVSAGAYRGFERTSRLLISNVETYDLFMNKFYIGKDVKVYYSDDEGKYRYGTISDIKDNILIGDNREIAITIDLQPFKYVNQTNIEITHQTDLYNSGNVYAKPLIYVYGEGLGNVYINGQTMKLEVDTSLLIDCIDIDIFNKDGIRANSRRKEGSFFILEEGKNIIDFDGAITRLEIDVAWRWR
ncbi:hypothetical protein [Senegalia massiliensis]|uniref:Phage tail protein n=1 Tax=Senegalia massiliensis TaxID=1720316 RepID=A0A845R2R1_9CLOT|nr:hypothetical protein [Senegalia massiliensis]NBI08249.1 hypothetical protein [Senegalia massiliensis]